MGKRNGMILAAVCVALMVAAGSIYAATAVQDVIQMENKAYGEHTKGIVTFTHKKHHEEYKVGCGECHHDANGKALNDLKMGDDVKNCIECHKSPGEVPGDLKKEWKAKKTPKDEQKKAEQGYHAAMIHDNCIGCHKDYNKKNNTKAAPQACTGCHPKTK